MSGKSLRIRFGEGAGEGKVRVPVQEYRLKSTTLF